MRKLRRLGSLLRSLGWRSPSSGSVKACPRCGSLNIKFSSKLDVWLTPKRYFCSDCGYVGPVIMEVEKTEEEETPRD